MRLWTKKSCLEPVFLDGVTSLEGWGTLCVSTGLRGVFPSLDRGVLKTFPGRSTNGLTSLMSGVLKWSEVGSGENTPLSKSATKPMPGDDEEFGAVLVVDDMAAELKEGLVALEVVLGQGWERGCTGVPSLCGETKLYNGEKVMPSSPDIAFIASFMGVRNEEPRRLDRL